MKVLKYALLFLSLNFFALTFDSRTWAGTISGKATFKGPPPKTEKIRMDADPACSHLHSEEVFQEDTVINSNGTLKNVFVYVKNGLEGKKFESPKKPFVLDQRGCQYSPHVFGIQTNQTLQILNSDSTLHNVHALPKKNKEFNIGMPLQGMKLEKSFNSPEVMVKFKCEVHPWMAGYAGVLDHPFFSVTNDQGLFELKDLPDGSYEIEAWHEKLGTLNQKIPVQGTRVTTTDFVFQSTALPETVHSAPTTAAANNVRTTVTPPTAGADDTAIINAYQRKKTWWLPDQASSYAGRIDWIFYLILYITGAVFFAVQGLLVYFLVRYRKKEGVKAIYYHGNNRLEIIWTAIPALIMIYLAFASQKTYGFIKGNPPENAFPVEISAEQFAWNIKYPGSDGKLGTSDDIVKVNQLHIPVDQPVRVKLISISKDGKHPVIHSFFVPEFRIKQDVVPGLPTEIWFQATKPGKFEIACAELCGLGHYRMRGFLTVHTQEGFQAWMQKEMAKSGK